MKKITTILAVLLFIVPSVSFAADLTSTQIQSILSLLSAFGADSATIANVQSALNGQPVSATSTNSSAVPSPSCISITYDLYSGTTDTTTNSQVSQLQQFLGVSPTGYFGPMTLLAVQNWQSSHGVISSGSSDTTGYGFVGPKTRSALAYGCSNNSSNQTSTNTTHPTTNTAPPITYSNSCNGTQYPACVGNYHFACPSSGPGYCVANDVSTNPVQPSPIYGCMNSAATNYNSAATSQWGVTCTYPVPNTNPSTPSAPTCNMSAPSPIMAGQSATLTWISTNASSVSITSIGSKASSGSIFVSPTQTTTYTGTFTGSGGSITCRTTIVVSQQTQTNTQAQNVLTVSIPSSKALVVPPGNNIFFGQIQFSTAGSSGDVNLSAIPLDLTVGGSGSASELSSCQLLNGTVPLNSGTNIVNPSNGENIFTLNQTLNIPKGTMILLTPVCNVASDTIDGSTFSWGINSNGNWPTTDTTNGSSIVENILTSTGQTVTISIPGSMTISVDSSTPPYSITTGGTTGVTMGIIKLHATNEAINLIKLGLTPTSGSPTDVTKLYVYNGSTLLGTASFVNGATTAIATLSSPFTLPVNTDTQLTIKADVASIGGGQLGTEGDLVKIDPSSGQGTGSYTSSTINATATGGVYGVRIFKTYPTVSLDTLPSSIGLASNTNNIPLMRFEIRANQAGPVNISKINFNIAPTRVTFSHLNVVVYNNSGYQPLPNGNSVSTGVVSISGNLQPISGTLTYSDSIRIPAGATYYFQVQGNFSSPPGYGDSVTSTLNGDTSFSGMNTLNGVSGNFVWSPNTNGSSGVNDNDWTNGFASFGIPAGGLAQTWNVH